MRYIAFCNILAVNNNPLEDYLKNFSICHRNTQFRSTSTTRGPRPPQFKFNNLINEHFPLPNFFSKVFFRVKTGEEDVNFYCTCKMV